MNCSKCKGDFEDCFLCSPTQKIKMKRCEKCGHIIDYYGKFKKKYPKSISQMIYEENYKVLPTKGCVELR